MQKEDLFFTENTSVKSKIKICCIFSVTPTQNNKTGLQSPSNDLKLCYYDKYEVQNKRTPNFEFLFKALINNETTIRGVRRVFSVRDVFATK